MHPRFPVWAALGLSFLVVLHAAPAIALTKTTLANGLTVVVERDPRHTSVGIALRYNVGKRDDPPGKRGLAHLTEHLMFEPTAHSEGRAFYDMVADLGGEGLNGLTGFDETVYLVRVPVGSWERMLWLESDRMAYMLGGLDDARLEKSQRIIKRESAQRVHGGFGPRIRALFQLLTPRGHPYAQLRREDGNTSPRIFVDDVDAITKSDVAWFFQRYYGPHNATLAVVGPMDEAMVIRASEKYFGPIANAVDGPPSRPAPPLRPPQFEVRGIHTNTSLPGLTLGWLVPREERWPARVVARYLNGYRGALDRDLILTGKAEKAAARFISSELGSVFAIDIDVDEGSDPRRVVAPASAVMTKLRRGIPSAVVAGIKQRLRVERLAGSTPLARATSLAAGQVASGGLRALAAVEAADVNRFIQTRLVANRRAALLTDLATSRAAVGRVTRGWR
ncbi:MAG: pitrilysin family protein [Myxococcota bacterium]